MRKWAKKSFGIALGVLACVSYVNVTAHATETQTGTYFCKIENDAVTLSDTPEGHIAAWITMTPEEKAQFVMSYDKTKDCLTVSGGDVQEIRLYASELHVAKDTTIDKVITKDKTVLSVTSGTHLTCEELGQGIIVKDGIVQEEQNYINKKDLSNCTIENTIAESYAYAAVEVKPALVIKDGESVLVENVDYTLTYANNLYPGVASVTITGMGDYTGTKTLEYTIVQKDVNELDIQQVEAVYNGATQKFVLKPIVNNGTTLQEGVDYTITPKTEGVDEVAAGVYAYDITGIGNYTGVKTVNYEIKAASLNACEITVENCVYTGTRTEAVPTVKYNEVALQLNKDFTLTYENVEGVGEATVIIKGIGNYCDSIEKKYAITQKDISELDIKAENTTFHGAEQNLKISSVTYGLDRLTENEDYTVSLKPDVENPAERTQTNAGTYEYVITGIGNYSGTKTITWTIAPKDIAGYSVTYMNSGHVYTGSAIEPTVSLSGNLAKGTDYTVTYTDNVNAGEATITVEGKGNYCGKIEKQFTINQREIKAVEFKEVKTVYNGEDQTFVLPEIKYNGIVLKENVDFTLKQSGEELICKNAGQYAFTIIGKGNFSNILSITWTIEAFDIEDCEIQDIGVYTYTGSDISVQILVKDGETELKEDVDFEVTYPEAHINAGTLKYKVTGIGNYGGQIFKEFTVGKADISNAEFTIDEVVYDGNNQVFKPSKVMYNNVALVEGEDYSISTEPISRNQTNAGKYTYTVKGTGTNFTGERNVYWTIKPANIPNNFSVAECVYTGAEVTPAVTITGLSQGVDYTVVYYNNIEPSAEAKVVVTGSGNYMGTAEKYFTIGKKNLQDIKISNLVTTFTGKELTLKLDKIQDEYVELIEGVDYVIDTSVLNVGVAQTNAGIYSYCISAAKDSSKYIGDTSVTWTINPIDINTLNPTYVTEYVYTGSEIKPSISMSFDGTALLESVDYEVTSNEKIETVTDTAITVTVKGKGNYNGTFSFPCTVKNTEIKAENITVGSAVYTGSPITFTPAQVMVAGKELKLDVDYTITGDNRTQTALGDYNYTITGIGNYSGSVSVVWSINQNSIASMVSGVAGSSFTYTGEAICPEVNTTLIKGTDYTLAYLNNVEVGTASVTVCGDGVYGGEVTYTFEIVPKDISSGVTYKQAKSVYMAVAQTFDAEDFTLSYGKYDLNIDKDFAIESINSVSTTQTNVGTYEYKIVGKGNYTGALVVDWTIDKYDLSNCAVTVDFSSNNVYDGTAKTPTAITVRRGDNNIVVPATEYTIAGYTNNTNAGTAYVKLTANSSNYSGTNEKGTFVIVPFTINAQNTSLDTKTYVYTGSGCKPNVTVKNGTKVITEKDDVTITVSYKNAISAGTATATITLTPGANNKNYKASTLTLDYKINKAEGKISILKGGNTFNDTVMNLYYADHNGTTISAKNPDGEVATMSWKQVQVYKYSESLGANNDLLGKEYPISIQDGKFVLKDNFAAEYTLTLTTAESANYKACTQTITMVLLPKSISITSATSTEAGKISLQWEQSSLTADGYRIYQVNDDGTETWLATTSTTDRYKTTSYSGNCGGKIQSGQSIKIVVRPYVTLGENKYNSGCLASKTITVK